MYSFLIVNKSTEQRLYEKANISSLLFVVAQQFLVGQGLLIVEVSRSHTGTPHSVGLRRRDPAWQRTRMQETAIHAPGGIRTGNLSKRAANTLTPLKAQPP